ncbi:hypothetical protein M0805_004499 [Coniferiporia weirii]|nr:hypothetical protein M0805_004499 [Coniferiporia weirii]
MDSTPIKQTTSTGNADIPSACKVLVVGGGPGGSYTAAALAREGLDVVLLEADVFPRYHIGESLLPAVRYLLRFIDLDSTFENKGFAKKVGAAFKLNKRNREGYTDFLASYGKDSYVWNVMRSEADDIFFRHAGKSGAKVFDGVKVTAVSFKDNADPASARPISATYARKSDGSTGEITFDYIVDASGRAGIVSTKYLKNRTYNQGLKNVAWWGYWDGAKPYGAGTPRENAPFFEALTENQDESGWAWTIPLRGATSVGLVMNQDIANKKKQAQTPTPSAREFYLENLKLAPNLYELISTGELVGSPDGGPIVKSASDYSYSASSYATPGLRVVGDAGAFIDPFFSSGVHLALTGGLSAAATICAAIRGDCSEEEAAKWHSDKVGSSYTWFLMVVLGAYKQMRAQSEPVLSDINEDNFDRAFDFLRPVIQGSLDVNKPLSQADLAKTLEFCSNLFESTQPEERDAVVEKIETTMSNDEDAVKSAMVESKANLTIEEKRVLDYVALRKAMRTEDSLSIKSFASDVIGGRRPRLERGSLGLMVIEAGATAKMVEGDEM